VITMLLPLALTLAMQTDGRSPLRRWFPVVAMAGAIPITISRSAIVGAIVGVAVLLPTLPRSARRLVILGGLGLGGAIFVLMPGMLGVLRNLFTNVTSDPSALSRTNSYGFVYEYFQGRPLFGRGFLTFLPKYRIVDNQYLGLLVDIGAVGLVAFFLLVLSGLCVSWRLHRIVSLETGHELAAGLAAGIAVGIVGFALFDGLAFPMASGFLFLELGLAGAIWCLAVNCRVGSAPPTPPSISVVEERTSQAKNAIS
jgi:O-antigen ligase